MKKTIGCPHCKGSTKCNCGADVLALNRLSVKAEGGSSIKGALGVSCFCVGVCDVCKGTGKIRVFR